MRRLRTFEPAVETDTESAIFSHQSYSPDVYAVCHHSGRYLLRSETNPRPLAFLREQHDFPGLPKLDRSFARAAHSYQHQHLAWSRMAIQSLALMLSGALMLAMVLTASRYSDYVPAGVLQPVFTIVLVLSGLAGTGLLLWGAYLAFRKEAMYHTSAAAQGLGPAVADYPLRVRYEIEAREEITASLGNALGKAPDTSQQACRVSVTAYPVEDDLESYAEYREQYRNQPVGACVHAGALALTGVHNVAFAEGVLEFGHRLVLRKSHHEVGMAQSGQGFQPFTIDAPYTIRRQVLCPREAEDERFLLECYPVLPTGDSRTLILHFDWRAPGRVPEIVLRKCTLDVPFDFRAGRVLRVVSGRHDADHGQVIWRNLAFQGRMLELSLFFEQPVLACQDLLRGAYEVEIDGLLSGLQIDPEHLWTAWGLKARAGDSVVRRKAVIKGDLALDLRRLSQAHEEIRSLAIASNLPPDRQLVEKVTSVLLNEGVDLRRIAQAAPRLNPAGSLDTRLHYWDIAGRRYDPALLDALDVHVVISGYGTVAPAQSETDPDARTEIDVRVRCLHDPRNRVTPEAVDAWMGPDAFGRDLAMRIRQAVEASEQAAAPGMSPP